MGRLIMDAGNLETIMAKHQAKKQAIKERKEEREEAARSRPCAYRGGHARAGGRERAVQGAGAGDH